MDFLPLLLLLLCHLCLVSGAPKVSAACDKEDDLRRIIGCLDPFLLKWESTRELVSGPGNVVIPVLHYSRDELLGLCESYESVRGLCFSDQLLDHCSSNSLINAVRSLGQYVCEIRDVDVQARFECISGALNEKPECRQLISAVPQDQSDAACERMESFFKCLQVPSSSQSPDVLELRGGEYKWFCSTGSQLNSINRASLSPS